MGGLATVQKSDNINMSKITIDITPDQHKRLKTIAALSGQSLKDYVLEKALPFEPDEQTAMDELIQYLKPRIEEARRGKVVNQSVEHIFQETYSEIDAKNV